MRGSAQLYVGIQMRSGCGLRTETRTWIRAELATKTCCKWALRAERGAGRVAAMTDTGSMRLPCTVCVCVCVVVAPLLGHCFPKGGGSKVCCKEGGQEGAARRVEQGMLCKEGREGVA